MKNILKGSIALVLILLTFGCSSEYLDPVPKTNLSDLTVFDNKDRVVAQVNGMYAVAKSGAFMGGRFFVYNDVRCENFIPKSSNLVTNFATWNHSVVASTNEVQNLWGQVYATINAINVFIEGLEGAKTSGKLDKIGVTQAEYDQYKSEAYALRAICYFDLLQMYSKPYNMSTGGNQGVPLRLKAMKSAAENDLAPSSVADVYNQILTDLNAAEPLAALSYSNDLLNTTRIHRNTIVAFKSRVLLHMQNWSGVVTETAKIVSASAPFTAPSGVAHVLSASYASLFGTPYTAKESIFSMPFTTTNGPGGQNGLPHYFNPASSESYYLVVSAGSTYSKIDPADARRTMMVTSGGNTFLGKYPDFTTLTNYAPVIRYAEVLLNRAEALVRAGGSITQGAVDLLNAVRTRSFPAGAYTLASFANTQAFYDAVLLERDIEFLGEGIRNQDCMRLSLTIPAKNGGAMGSVPAIPPSGSTYIWPVPASEQAYNKLMPNN